MLFAIVATLAAFATATAIAYWLTDGFTNL